MRRLPFLLATAGVLLACAARQALAPPIPQPRALFDGVSLAGWDGDPRFWSVEAGCIVGRSTPANPCNDTTYLVWRGGEVADFELRLEFRITGGNSGVQFRSRDDGGWQVSGFQADLEDGPDWTGCLYEQNGVGVAATRGERVEIDALGSTRSRFADGAELLGRVRVHEWNHYVVRARGERVELELNGARTVELADLRPARSLSGLLALQLHQGSPMQVEYRNLELLALPLTVAAPVRTKRADEAAPPGDAPGVDAAADTPTVRPQARGARPQWVWTNASAPAGDVATLVRRFELSQPAARATLRGAADNHLRVFVDGAQVLAGDDWATPGECDVTPRLGEGPHELALVARNDDGPAAAWLELVVEGDGGRALRLVSDASWSAQPAPGGTTFESWTPRDFDATRASPPFVHGPYGMGPWGGAADDAAAENESALAADALVLPAGFRAELLYSVPKAAQGSWVSMCEDPRGRMYVSDQYGALFRVTVGPPGSATGASATQVERVAVDLGSAQGLCWAFESLYVVVSDGATGLYRVRDTDGDDHLDSVALLRKFDGGGEHGPHAVVPGPDGKSLWIVAGNFTHLPEPLDATRVPRTWQEDELLPHLADPNGHDPHILAPGGWVCRTDEDGARWELFAIGMRNAYDIAFAPDGELFTFDSDMEWDIGAPWYRPTRVLHLVSGADYGWRNGSAKWRADWPDTLPSVCDVGLSSPTGLAFGTRAHFPPKYRRALFALDWAYGAIYAVYLEPKGASFTGTFEKFASGRPFAVTDVVVARDGAMYVLTGGRRTQSGLYRIAWTGTEPGSPPIHSTEDSVHAFPRVEWFGGEPGSVPAHAASAPASPPVESLDGEPASALGSALPSARQRRRELEQWTVEAPDLDDFARAVLGAQAAEQLASPDPFLRNAARVACEQLAERNWRRQRGDPSSCAALIALLHEDGPGNRDAVLLALGGVDLATIDAPVLLDCLRVYQLALLRCGPFDDAELATLRSRIGPSYPSGSRDADSELVRVLAYLDEPRVLEPALAVLASDATQEEQIHYAHCLLALKSGWSAATRRHYLELLDALRARSTGGLSLAKFIDAIRERFVEGLSRAERAELGALAEPPKAASSTAVAASAPFVRRWTREELLELLRGAPCETSAERGAAVFAKARCAECHRFAGAGGATGPDLTGAGARFNTSDLLDSLLEPSKVLSDQFQDVEFLTLDGELLVGRIEREADGVIALRRLPPQEDVVELELGEIESRRPHPLSRMPSGLLDVLDAREVRELIAYVLGGVAPAAAPVH